MERKKGQKPSEISKGGLINIKTNGTISEWNEGAEIIFGYTAKESVGKHISILFCEEIFENEKRIIRNLKKGSKEYYEAACKNKNGNTIYISFTAFPITDQNGKVVEISQFAKDISGHKIAYEKQNILAAIVNSSDDAIISKTLDGIITSWNHAATKMFGYSEKEVIGKHISIIIPIDRLPEETLIIENIRKGKKIDHFETIRISNDGSERQLSITVSPIKDNKGKIIGASKIARDISIRVEAEKQHQIYLQRLQELSNYKDEFMVMASHELKTPLTVILASLQILEMEMRNDVRSRFVDKTIKQVKKLSGLITNLLDVSKIQAGKLVLNNSKIDINYLVEEVVNNLQHTTKNQSLHYNKQDKPLLANGDKERLEQVLINIIGNAIKYSGDNGKINISAARKGKNIVVNVLDKGIGITDKDIENVFLRFYRGSGAASSYSGSGVGLYISSEIIKSHGGKIWAESEIGKGSSFHFSIPAI
ncbi:MAG: PAS domain S-box protein [Ginsengibacter sp.]